MWTNESMARYFGVKAVKVAKPEAEVSEEETSGLPS